MTSSCTRSSSKPITLSPASSGGHKMKWELFRLASLRPNRIVPRFLSHLRVSFRHAREHPPGSDLRVARRPAPLRTQFYHLRRPTLPLGSNREMDHWPPHSDVARRPPSRLDLPARSASQNAGRGHGRLMTTGFHCFKTRTLRMSQAISGPNRSIQSGRGPALQDTSRIPTGFRVRQSSAALHCTLSAGSFRANIAPCHSPIKSGKSALQPVAERLIS